MAITARRTRSGRVYWVSFYFEGKQLWERSGTERREAEQLERKRKREVADGTYAPGRKPTMKVGAWLAQWMAARTNRNADDDRKLVTRFLLTREWLCELACEDVRPQHTARLVDELKATPNEKTRKPISEKYVSNLYGLWRTSMQDARIAELVPVDPCVLKRGTLRRKARRGVRSAYELAEIGRMLDKPGSEPTTFAALAFLTGGREGEIVGRRWSDWDRGALPLGALAITTQYDDRPLKTEKGEGEHARVVPVHPVLAALLDRWWSHGFEFVHCRKPTPSDFILPRTSDGKPHTRSSAYKRWRRYCAELGVGNRSLHSTRHTFITQCRRAGAREEVVERITHNAVGTIVDQYTHWDWGPLCDAVLCLRLPIDPNLDSIPLPSSKTVEALGIEVRAPHLDTRNTEALDGKLIRSGAPPLLPGIPQDAARPCARQETPTPADTDPGRSSELAPNAAFRRATPSERAFRAAAWMQLRGAA